MQAKLIDRAVRKLKAGLDTTASVKVTVAFQNDSIPDLDAIPGRRDFVEYLVEENRGTSLDFDWIVSAADLVFAEHGKLEPAKGWEIRYQMEDGREAIYEAIATTGTRCFDVVDQLGILYRIHTKLREIRAIDAP